MKRPSVPRAVRYLVCAAVLLGGFEACSADEASAPPAPSGPVSVSITSLTLGQGVLGEGGSPVLACGYQIGVVLQLGSGWRLAPPGLCATPQCGQVRVSLLDSDGSEIASQLAATVGVDLNVKKLQERAGSGNAAELHDYSIRAELVEDSSVSSSALDGGNASSERHFQMSLPTDCSTPSGLGGAPGSSGAGNAGTTAASAGDGGAGGVATQP